ncbi:Spy/CpxP family protein refolding chaperone [Stigmatella sp. ncwal1]|uniref:Spy/CpxP family protein refolding chaperone n=1 Tax=Stigmatella ashevillensis TaxID=2995309 RepID=A0ABT5D3J9_9BACT|nr:Spy/CpxP family protein refolding chaperone [Stigmatella ashevillena]MDC0708232.1 Spy/CpxP family protein refolding chaperone [Stigmatella ashevillena]
MELLLEHTQDLGLTDAQSNSLESIHQALLQKNAPLKKTLEQLRPPPPMDGNQTRQGPPDEAMRARFEQAHDTLQQMKDNNDAAYSEAESLLSDEQKQKARALISQEIELREKHRESMQQRRRERMGPSGGSL